MELSDLNVFRSVVVEGGVTRAAAHLHRVPSNVTTRIRNLEERLGVQLFHRENKRMRLTPQGEVLLEYADRLLTLARQAKEALHNARPIGRLRLGSMESTAAARLPNLLSEYHKRYAEVALELRIAPTRDLINEVLDGSLDSALVADKVSDARLGSLAIYEEKLVLIAAKEQSRIRKPEDIATGCALTFSPGCAYRERLEGWFAQAGVVPRRLVELSSYHAILGCVVAGMGVALIPQSILATYPSRSQLSVHALPKGISVSHTYLIWRNGVKSAKIEALKKMLVRHSSYK